MNPKIKSIYANFFDMDEETYYIITMDIGYAERWDVWKDIVERYWIGLKNNKIVRI